eukprot:536167_1
MNHQRAISRWQIICIKTINTTNTNTTESRTVDAKRFLSRSLSPSSSCSSHQKLDDSFRMCIGCTLPAKVMNQVKTQRDASIDGVNININADKTTSHEVRRRQRVMNGNNRRGKRVSHLLCSYLLCICLVCIPACLL